MKKIFLIITLFLIVSSSLIYALDIIECYNSIPEELLGGSKIELIEKNNKWFYNDGMSRELVEADVDRENYYLRLHFGGGGCGGYYEIAIFLTKFDYYIVAINLINWSMGGTWSDLKFYKYNNWKDITEDIFPLTDIAPFFNSTYFREISKKINHVDYVFSIEYELPRYGTTVIAYLRPTGIYDNADDYKEKKDLYEHFRENPKYTSIEIAYDYKNARFYIAKKI